VFLLVILTLFLLMQSGMRSTPTPVTVTTTLTTKMATVLTVSITTTITEIHTTTVTKGPVEISNLCFSRTDSCDKLLVDLIDRAKHRIHVAIFTFTSDVLAEALIRAHMRGVEVLVVLELDQVSVRGSEYGRLRSSGVNVRVDGNPSLMHHKFMVIDDKIVVTGSYNWSAAAEDRNDENLVVIISEKINQSYEREFQRIWSQAVVT